jgi:hypothetical protein
MQIGHNKFIYSICLKFICRDIISSVDMPFHNINAVFTMVRSRLKYLSVAVDYFLCFIYDAVSGSYSLMLDINGEVTIQEKLSS